MKKIVLSGLFASGLMMGAANGQDVPKVDRSQISLGNGANSSIDIEGAVQNGSDYTFRSVTIDKNGWLVMHPFKDGKPVGTVYVGHTYVEKGTTENVTISVSNNPGPNEPYIVMLHYDMNDDGVFDFNDGVTVPDAPVFEGTTMIAHRFISPK